MTRRTCNWRHITPTRPRRINDYAVYYDRLQDLDDQVGEILDQLAADGLADSTIVFYYADHGGAVAGSKRFLTEDGLHVPMLIRVPEQFSQLVAYERTGIVDRPVSFCRPAAHAAAHCRH